MDRIGYIYKLTTPEGKIYIGKTKSIRRRFNKYKNCFEQGLMYIEIRKFGWENIYKEFLFISKYNEKLFSDLECHYIRLYNSFDSSIGLNSQSGGKKGFKTSRKALNNMSKSHIGYKMSKSQKDKISISNTGRSWILSNESKINMCKAKRKGREILNLNTGVFFDSVLEAAHSIGIKRTTLNAKLTGQNINNTGIKYI